MKSRNIQKSRVLFQIPMKIRGVDGCGHGGRGAALAFAEGGRSGHGLGAGRGGLRVPQRRGGVGAAGGAARLRGGKRGVFQGEAALRFLMEEESKKPLMDVDFSFLCGCCQPQFQAILLKCHPASKALCRLLCLAVCFAWVSRWSKGISMDFWRLKSEPEASALGGDIDEIIGPMESGV